MTQTPSQTARLQRDLLDDAVRSAAKLRTRECEPRDIQNLLKLELDRAQLSWATGAADVDEVKDALARCAGAGQACALVVLRLADPVLGGKITLTEPGLPPRPVPLSAVAFGLEDWIGAWHAAVLARDVATLQLLCTAEVIGASTPPADLMDPVWAPVCGLLAAATVAPQHLGIWTDQVRRDAAGARLPPAVLAGRIDPVVQLAEAMAASDPTAFLNGLPGALDAHRVFWQSKDLEHHARAAWPLEVAALTVLALDSRLITLPDLDSLSLTIPVSLFAGEPRTALSVTEVIWPKRAALSAAEANWFLDLKAIPREGRTHQLVMIDGRLTAVYRFSAALVPRGTVSFALVDRLEDAGLPPALDAGELLLLAERFASLTPPPDPAPVEVEAYRDLIADAVAALDAALVRIPPGADAVPAETLTSPAAQHILTEEPGRFRKDRLEAYRRGIAGALARLASAPPAPDAQSGAQPDLKIQTLAAAEAIKASVLPLLQALAGEDGAEIAAGMVPTEADFTAAFADTITAGEARRGYAAAWSTIPEVDPVDTWLDLQVEAAAAGLLRTKNALSERFPQAYRAISDKLSPSNVWLCWRYVTTPDGAGESYDGLVWLNGRWVWFPKPWRYFEGG